MGKGGCYIAASGGPLKSKAPLGFLGTVYRVVADFGNASASTRSDYYKVSAACVQKKARTVPFGTDKEFTRAEVEEHCTVEDCWLILKGKVYDVTDFAPNHPGGRVIYTYGGKDATDVFTAFHAGSSWARLSEFQVGHLTAADAAEEVSSVVADFRELRSTLHKEGLFKSNKLWYAGLFTSIVSIAALSYAVLALGGSTWLGFLTSSFLLGLFWQQCGWLAHDCCHNQVFANRQYNTLAGLLVGGVFAGFSVDWWKGKHNTHHAAPNEVTASGMPVDPDVDTLPLIAWSPELLSTVKDPAYRAFIRRQHVLFFPILCFARMSWAQQSAVHPGDTPKHTANAQPAVEKASLGIHYLALAAFALSQLPLLQSIGFVVASQMFSGFMLSLVFVQSHNGMEIYSGTKDFFSAQIVSTRDIFGTAFNDWFTGGLNYQIEHHLYPTLPRHNLRKVQLRVMEICKKHGLLYENCSMAEGTVKVLKALAEIAAIA